MATALSISSGRENACWPALFSLFMGVTSLIAAEFIPVSLLTPMALDLGISEGMAGQSVTAVGVFAVITSLLLTPLAGNIDRRRILLTFSFLLTASNLIVALAPGYGVLLAGRCLLGVCVGGFWSLASAVALQLAPPKDIPRALSVIYSGVSVATVLALPLASQLGHAVGWRNVFLLAALMGALAFVWQYLALPSLPAREGGNFKGMRALLGRRWVLAGMGATVFSYGGYHVFFTYLRPFLEHSLALGPDALAAGLLAFGLANCLGTVCAGMLMGRYFRPAMLGIHTALALVAVLLFTGRVPLWGGLALVTTWGFIFGFIPVGWSTWITRALADKAEIAGGLSVAAIQFSIGLAAAVGGFTVDHFGIEAIFPAAALFLCLALGLIRGSFRLFAVEKGRPV